VSGKFIVVDLMCGAGGSSEGAEQAFAELGLIIDLRVLNHWQVSIDTHSLNHPNAKHFCQDIATARPRVIVPEGRIDLLMASPSCTFHSNARGGLPTSDQQRSDPWHIITWLTELDVERLIMENVWEWRHWGPIDPDTGRPIREKRGIYFQAFLVMLRQIGYEPEFRKLNCVDYGEAQSRPRLILTAKKRGKAVFPAPTHGHGLAQQYRPAREIIDWSIVGQSIFTRKKKLAQATLERIENGLIRNNWPEPFLVVLRNHMAGRSLDDPLPTIAANGGHIALAQPFVLSQASGGVGRAVDHPLPTVVTGGAVSLIAPYYGSGSGETCSSVDRPLPTMTGKARFGLVMPVTHSDRSCRARDVDADPLPTITTAKRGELALVHSLGCDIHFRMLQPHELGGGQGFPGRYRFTGTKADQIKQIGNAVPVKLMKACVLAMMADVAAPVMEAAE
jgi:DNA (cytosine-5)-methyltransferase 1